MSRPAMDEMMRAAAARDPGWLAALRVLHAGGRTPDLTCDREAGRRECRGKLVDGKTPAFEFWDGHVVRYRGGCVVGMGSSMKAAWEDAQATAAAVVNACGLDADVPCTTGEE